ncbi:MAG: mannose-1-phosphate guanylyltransferase/mannose-6-phosphate isomerase [Patescibacteria group bacterium]|nr:mannose-1-phosphate guanylyltransferase/mannose-6-phosphate isomerase [Patescibacteria group bacterium]
MKNLYGVILAGGSGTRLWPISRELYPKQLLKLFGNKTLIQQTFARLKKIISPEHIYIITSGSFADGVYLQLRHLGLERGNIIIEVARKNTGPAAALASKKIFEKDKAAVILVSPADHIIKSEAEFFKNVKAAVKEAGRGFLVIFGISPNYSNIDYGYIKTSLKNKDKKLKTVLAVEKFIEKPDFKKAKKLIDENYLWNSGIFVWKAKTVLNEIKNHLPKVHKAINSDNRKLYSSLQAVSIDEGVLGKSNKIRVVPASFKWTDIGSWKTLHDFLPKNSDNNVLTGKIFALECKNSLIHGTSEKRAIMAIGLNNLAVVDTEDAVLISHKDKTHNVKKLLKKMKSDNIPQYSQHMTMFRPWGMFTVVEEGDGFKVKKIVVNPKQKTSLQRHDKRSEHWVVLKGVAKVALNDNIIYLNQHQSIDIPIGVIHRLENSEIIPLEIIEVQNGNYLGEDDIIRVKDKYKRNTQTI